jgi:hypothetical protein
MHRSSLTVLLVLLALFAFERRASACPMCQEAVPNTSSAEDEDQARLSRAYNNSILLMVGVPYMLVGGVGFLIYRQVRLRAAVEASTARPLSPGQPLPQHPGETSCPTRSPGEAS